jgi:LacI family transcriptional regulator
VLRPRRVVLLIESSRGYGRGLLHGIAEYLRSREPWTLTFERHGLYQRVPAWLPDWQGDGIIARVENRRLARAIRRHRVPSVDLRGRLADLPMPAILTDDAEGGRLAAEHLLERGFRRFAYCGFAGLSYSEERLRVFRETIEKAGYVCAAYLPPARGPRGDTEQVDQQALAYQKDLARWLKSLPRPIGVMAGNDARGQQILNACRDLGIAVPDEVAVIGVDNDEVLCELCHPPLSSVAPNTRKIGYEAAALLDQLMAGAAPPREPIYIPPLGVVARQSTDILSFEDRAITTAVRFIREHACDGITMEDVLTRVPVSWGTLERQFRKILGHTPKAEMVRVQLDRVKQLLVETRLSLKEIAARAGFRHPEYMCALFKSKTGKTPGQYRAQGQPKPY